MFVKNVANLLSTGFINPIGENIVRLNAVTKLILQQCLGKTLAVALQKSVLTAVKSSTPLNPRKNILTESVVQENVKIFNMVIKSLVRIIRSGLVVQRDIGVAIGE
jgi:hypothetical protein